ncbi:MAG: serine protease [Candidatus Methanoperedens sp.]
MIKSGGTFLFKGYRCVIGAVIQIKDRRYIAAASHIFHKTDMGSHVQVESAEGVVRKFMEDYDVALIELPSGCKAGVTELGSAAVMEEALLVNEHHTITCMVIRAGASLLYLQFPCSDMPQPGDSGSPVLQEGKVIGLLSSVALGNCTGTAVSSDVLRNLSL